MLHTELIRPIGDLLRAHAATQGERVAFEDDRRQVNYADLERRTAALAGGLQDRGIAAGDRVLLYLDNAVEVAECYLGIPRCGAVAVCVNPAGTPPEIAHVLDDSGARLVITDPEYRETAQRLVEDQAARTGSQTAESILVTGAEYEAVVGSDASGQLRETQLDDVSYMLYTSGTTGKPKGVLLTQRGCLWVTAACWVPILGLERDDVVLSPLPLFHSYALVMSIVGTIAVGARTILLRRFSPSDVLERLSRDDVTLFPGVPTMFNYLLHEAPGGFRSASLRRAMSAGAILPAVVNEQFEKEFGVPLLDGYGITETSTMVTMNSPHGTRKPGSCGLPLPGLTVRLVDPASGVDVERPGQIGELWVQGPNVALGYHGLPDATAASFVGGWYRTGDLGFRDMDGYLTISGRTKELIIRGGENIYPAEVEDVLLGLDMIEDAAVVGLPHESLGEVPVAFVVPAAGYDQDAVLAAAREQLSSFKVPTMLIETNSIPRTGSGKVLRFRLSAQLEG